MDSIHEIVAKNLRKLRLEKGLSQEELARLSGVSKSMLVQIERGMGNPSLSTMQKLAGGMQIPFDAPLSPPQFPLSAGEVLPAGADPGRPGRRQKLCPFSRG